MKNDWGFPVFFYCYPRQDEKDGADAESVDEAASRGREILRVATSKIFVTESCTVPAAVSSKSLFSSCILSVSSSHKILIRIK